MIAYDAALLLRARMRASPPIAAPTAVGRASNPLCGDRIEVSARIVDGIIVASAYETDGCAVTTASASILADLVPGRPTAAALELGDGLGAALADPRRALPAGFEPLAFTRLLPTRRRCALLPWEALRRALATDVKDRA